MDHAGKVRATWERRLEFRPITTDTDFFEAGGDSLSALLVLGDLAEDGFVLELDDFYRNPTVAAQAALIAPAEPMAGNRAAGQVVQEAAELPLTPLQSGLVLTALAAPERDPFWLTTVHRLPAGTSAERAAAAWQATVDANPALRTRVSLGPDGAAQIVEPAGRPQRLDTLTVLDLDDPASRDAAIAARLARLRAAWTERLCEATYVARAGGGPALLLQIHHLTFDGWTLAQVMTDFRAALGGARPEPRPSVAAYVRWSATVAEAATAYWRTQLSGLGPAAELDIAEPSGNPVAPQRRARTRLLDDQASGALAGWCTRTGTTVAAVATYLWGRLLARYQRDDEICVGVTTATRPAQVPGAGRMSGCLLAVVPIRVPDGDADPAAAVRRTRDALADAARHAHLGTATLAALAGRPASEPLFRSTLVVQNYAGADDLARNRLHEEGSTGDELCLTVTAGERIELFLEWDGARYADAAIADLADDLAYWLARPDELTGDRARDGWVPPGGGSGAVRGEAAARRPFAVTALLARGADADVAVIDGDTELTYAELRLRAARLAAHLRDEVGARPGDPVALVGARGADAAVAICGAWLAGLPWCAIDPSLPEARRAAILAALRPVAVVPAAPAEHAAGSYAAEHAAASHAAKPAAGSPAAGPAAGLHPVGPAAGLHAVGPAAGLHGAELAADAPAYFVATSGSTGRPKLAVQGAGGLGPLIDAWAAEYGAGPHRVLQMGSWTADVFLGDLLKALATGGTLIVCPDERRVDVAHVAGLIRSHRATFIESTPTVMNALFREIARGGPVPSLRTAVVGSDVFRTRELADLVALRPPGVRLVNGYGLSEATIESFVYECAEPAVTRSGLAPIGVPLPGTRAAVVDDRGRLLPVGALGRLRLSGAQVGLGYQTTEGRAATGGFADTPDFRTGDLVLLGHDGCWQFFGRQDSQVKIGGYRVELGEVENALLTLPHVAEAFAWVTPGRVLCAAVGARGTDGEEVRTALATLLPVHAVPSRVRVLERLPRTENGKIDRAVLTVDRPGEAATGGGLEDRIAAVWQELLGAPVERDRSFFDSGGTSALLIGLHERLRAELPGHAFTMADLFRHPTVGGFARALTSSASPAPPDPTASRRAMLERVARGEMAVEDALAELARS